MIFKNNHAFFPWWTLPETGFETPETGVSFFSVQHWISEQDIFNLKILASYEQSFS